MPGRKRRETCKEHSEEEGRRKKEEGKEGSRARCKSETETEEERLGGLSL